MSVDRTDWQCCRDVGNGLMCNKALVNYGQSHDGPCEHEHEFGGGVCLDCGIKKKYRGSIKGPYHDVAPRRIVHVCDSQPTCLCAGTGTCDCTRGVGLPAWCRKCHAPLILIDCDTGEETTL